MGIFKGIVGLLMAAVVALVIMGILSTIPAAVVATYFNEIEDVAKAKVVSLTAPAAIAVATAIAILLTNWRRHKDTRLSVLDNAQSAIAGGLAVAAEFHIAILTSNQVLMDLADRTNNFLPERKTIELDVELFHITDLNVFETLTRIAIATLPELLLIFLGTGVVMLITGRACTMTAPSRETTLATIKRSAGETWEQVQLRFGANPKSAQQRKSYERAAARLRNT